MAATTERAILAGGREHSDMRSVQEKQRWRCAMRSLVTGVVVGTLVPFLAFAESASAAASQISAARTAAMRECTTRAQRYTEYIWGNMDFQQYRACMREHRETE
jgi:hypothetical protein